MNAPLGIVTVTLVLGCSPPVLEVGKSTLSADTVWRGSILVTGDVHVPQGVTLTILPGTSVKFRRIDKDSGLNLFLVDSPYFPQAELIVEGRLLAQGTEGDIIVFTSGEKDAQPGDWGGINLLGSDGSVIQYAKVLFAYNGVHAHGSRALISHNEFLRNGVAISFKKESDAPELRWNNRDADITITHNRIHDNKGGVNVRASRAVVSFNEITANKLFGIWLKEDTAALVTFNTVSGSEKGLFLFRSAGAVIRHNNLAGNTRYAAAVAEEQERDVDARENWWGTVSPEDVQERVFDHGDDTAVGTIQVEPVLRQAMPGAAP